MTKSLGLRVIALVKYLCLTCSCQALISCGPVCSEGQLSELITDLTGSQPGTAVHTDLLMETREKAERIPSGSQRQPVILILDPVFITLFSLIQYYLSEIMTVVKCHIQDHEFLAPVTTVGFYW